MKKRVLSLFTAVMCLLVFVGCTGSLNMKEDEAKTNIVKAMEKQGSLQQFDTTVKLKVKVPVDGVTQEMNVNVKIQADFKDKSTAGFVMQGKFSYTAFNLDMSAAYKDGYVYLQAAGMKSKEKISFEEASQSVSALVQNNVKFTEGMLKNVTAKKQGSNKQYNFELDESKSNDILKAILGSLSAVAQEEFDSEDIGDNIAVSGGSGQVVVNKEGYVTKYVLTLQVAGKSDGEDVTADMDFEVEYQNPGQQVNLEYPTDLDTYSEGSDISLY